MVRVVGHKPKCVQEKVYLYQLTKKKKPKSQMCTHTNICIYTVFNLRSGLFFFFFSPTICLLFFFPRSLYSRHP